MPKLAVLILWERLLNSCVDISALVLKGLAKSRILARLRALRIHLARASFLPLTRMLMWRNSAVLTPLMHLIICRIINMTALDLPHKCSLVAVELVEDSIELPSFRHPTRAAYVLGPEMGSVSPELMAKCDHVIKIPMKFCVNVGVAGALVMYDRVISMGKFAPRPVRAGGPTEALPPKQTTLRRKVRNPKKSA